MPQTDHGLVYPELGDDNNPPADIQAAAQSVDGRYGLAVASPGNLAAVSSPYVGMRVWVTSIKRHAVYNGTAWTWATYHSKTNTSTTGPTSGTSPLTLVTSDDLNFDGVTRHEVAFNWYGHFQSKNDDRYNVAIFDGDTQIASVRTEMSNADGFSAAGGYVRGLLVPDISVHTFTAQIVRDNGTGAATVVGASTVPMTLTVRPFA